MKNLIYIIALFSGFTAFSQEDAWVYFTDKQDADSFLDNPLQMLSQRSLNRRIAQNIPLDIKDVPITETYVTQIENAAGIAVLARSKWLNAVHVRGFQQSISSLSQLAFVSYIDFANDAFDIGSGKKSHKPFPDQLQPLPLASRTSDIQADFNYGTSANQIQMLNGNQLHAQDFTGQGKIIAVMDAGFPSVDQAQPFQRLRENNLILGGYNFVDRNENIYTRNNHGTLVLSTMGGYAEGELVGTAPDAQYYLFITEATEYENPVEESLWVEAAERADSLGVDVINTSLGYPAYSNPAYDYSYEERDGNKAFISRGADIAFSRGMVVVVSAGNEGNSDSDNYISVPADAHSVLTVGAVNALENYASFSSIGPTVDGRVKPDVVARGQSAVVSNVFGEIVTANGTSFSSPIMAGMVATFWSAVPDLTNQQIVDFVKQSSDQFANPTPQKGYGVPDFALALQNALTIEEVSKDVFVVWPNPVKAMVNVKFPSVSDEAIFEIYDQYGKSIFSSQLSIQNNSVDCSRLSTGIYAYRLTTSGATQTGKFIKN